MSLKSGLPEQKSGVLFKVALLFYGMYHIIFIHTYELAANIDPTRHVLPEL